MQVHFANIWQAIADAFGARTALVHGDERVTWSEYDDRAARLAQAFHDAGLQPDAKVALYLYNGIEYATAQYAAFKVRGVPVNVNYRYTDNEVLYLLENSDAEVLLFHTSLGDRVRSVLGRAPKLRLVIEVDDGGPHVDGARRWDDVLASHEPAERIEGQPGDVYMLYTGGTTGMPKGVMYAQGVFPLADSLARLDAAELVLRKASWLYDHGKPCGREANTAKYLCADAGFQAADRALQTHGGMGYAEEYNVARYFREARLMKIAPVSQEMVLNYLGSHVLGLPRSY